MFLDFKVPIPSVKGKIFIKKVRDFHYVHYEYDSVYDSVKQCTCRYDSKVYINFRYFIDQCIWWNVEWTSDIFMFDGGYNNRRNRFYLNLSFI